MAPDTLPYRIEPSLYVWNDPWNDPLDIPLPDVAIGRRTAASEIEAGLAELGVQVPKLG